MDAWPTLTTRRQTLTKRVPMVISRGTLAATEGMFVGLDEGLGEHSPATGSPFTAARGEAQLVAFWAELSRSDPGRCTPFDIWNAMRGAGIDPPAMAALDVALWDLLAKRAGMPLHAMLGLPRRSVPTSVTIGIGPPEVTREQVPELLARTGARYLKVKMGSPDGLDADRAHFLAAEEAALLFGARLRVDANGGWSPEDAPGMIAWLAGHGVEYVEQPLAEGREDDLPDVFAGRALPIYLDESCRFAADVPRLVGRCDGVNLKLMKCGGITEALRIVAAARAHGLRTMIGCMSDSSVSIAAGASIAALFDSVDLDSHLNLAPDPADGAPIIDGIVLPIPRPGHGGRLRDDTEA